MAAPIPLLAPVMKTLLGFDVMGAMYLCWTSSVLNHQQEPAQGHSLLSFDGANVPTP